MGKRVCARGELGTVGPGNRRREPGGLCRGPLSFRHCLDACFGVSRRRCWTGTIISRAVAPLLPQTKHNVHLVAATHSSPP